MNEEQMNQALHAVHDVTVSAVLSSSRDRRAHGVILACD